MTENKYLLQLKNANFINRLFAKDAALWKSEEADNIKNSLGWLSVVDKMIPAVENLRGFAAAVRVKFSDCVILGMGGSSLAPEVMRSVFGSADGFPTMHVLDTVNPSQILELKNKLNLSKTLFIYASKSGTTIEPACLFEYFFSEVKKEVENAGHNFIAITDSGTELEKLSKESGFLETFINPSDIGGRYSALSYFGLVPAVIMGIDIEKFIARAKDTLEKFRTAGYTTGNTALALGAFMGANALEGKDKLTLLCSKNLSAFGLWVEQLVAESTGKEDKGILPVVHETHPAVYSADRFFVSVGLNEKPAEPSDFPVFNLEMGDKYDLAEQFIIWELATATAGFFLKINPFSQPDVELSKHLTREKLKTLASNLSLQAEQSNLSTNFTDDIVKTLQNKKYCALLAYCAQGAQMEEFLNNAAREINGKTGKPVVWGFGPRYLHSSGQLYKGGTKDGLFVIMTFETPKDISIPNKIFTFGQLEYSQAQGDCEALLAKQRTAIMLQNLRVCV